MSLQTKLAGPQVVTTAAAQNVGAAVPTGMTVKVTSITLQQPAGGDAKVISLSIGALATATIVRTYAIPAGTLYFTDYPNFVLAAADQLQVQQVGGTSGQVNLTCSGVKDLATA